MDYCDGHPHKRDRRGNNDDAVDVDGQRNIHISDVLAPQGDLPVSKLSETSLVIADELRRAELSINTATRDTAQFLVSTLDAAANHRLSAAMTHDTVKAAVNALAALVESQGQMAMRAHRATEKVGRNLGLDETSWGEGLPKPHGNAFETRAAINA